MSSVFGVLFQVSTFGESHGPGIGAVVDGCPAGIAMGEADLQRQLDRRRPGRGPLTSSRNEADRVEILSGIEKGVTLGTPIAMLIRNTDQKPSDYERFRNIPRPSHADLAYRLKYGVAASSGGGRASARETAARVGAGAVAERFLRVRHGVDVVAWVSAVGVVEATDMTDSDLTREQVDSNEVRCPDARVAADMIVEIAKAVEDGDSVGGIVTCVCRHVPAGWGEPVFDKLGAILASAMMSIPAAKGFEIGSGFAGTRMRGSQHNDAFLMRDGRLGTGSNRSGGVQGGITNGEPVVFRVGFKPPATIARPQNTVDYDGKPVVLEAGGRHDPCVVPRAVPIVEAMAALVLADAALLASAPRGGS